MSRSMLSHPQRVWLQGEMDVWQAQGLLTAEQAERILDLYESPAESAERQKSVALFVLVGLAASMIGLAALLLIGYNWNALPAFFKLVLIFGVVIGTHLAGWRLRYHTGLHRTSEAVFFLGCLLYGAGIWLVAQVFHLNSHYPDGIWWWALGVLPFALLLDTVLLHVLLTSLLALWVGVEVLGFSHLGGWLFGRWGMLPNGAYSLPFLALPGFLWAYRKKSVVAVGLYAPLVAWWLLLQPVAWHLDLNPMYLIGAVGSLFLIVAESHPAGSRFAVPYRLYGVLISAGILIPLTFYAVNSELARDRHLLAGLVQTAGIVLVTATALVAGAWLRRRSAGQVNPFEDELRSFVRRQWLPCSLALLMAFLASWNALLGQTAEREYTAILPTLLANAAMIACAFWLMRLGLGEDRGLPFAGGVGFFVLWAILRYIDLFGHLGGMLGASCMFFLCGLALLGVALFWRRRKEVRHAT